MKKNLTGITLATAAATLFIAAPLATTFAATTAHTVKCFGANSCRGQSACRSTSNACRGLNRCKSKGFIRTVTREDCEDRGGRLTE